MPATPPLLALALFFRGSRSWFLRSRFAKLQDELVGVSANRLVEHFCRAGVCRIGENRTLRVELEPGRFNLPAHRGGLDAMQSLGYFDGRAGCGGMIENYIYATGFQ